MGTHISRVKSVDLDSWTDEQLQSILNWGNARANKYWEAKLAPGHAPSEAKIENFIRTKYELKRWVMDGPMPDPSTLDVDGDDDVPLSVVKEKKVMERRESLRKASLGQSSSPGPIRAPPGDLIGGDPIPQRSSTAGPTASKVPPKGGPAPPKATSTKDSLLGLDFLGGETTAPPRPASTTGTPLGGTQSRPDLKQSILSLYATAPRPQQQPAPQAPSGSMSGGMSSPTGMGQSQNAFGGMNDAFSSLSFASSPPVKPPQNDAFANLGSFSSPRPAAAPATSSFSTLSGGSFFDTKPAAPAHQPKQSIGNSFGGFGSISPPPLASPPAQAFKPTAAPPSAALGDLFDFSAPSPPRAVAPAQPSAAPMSTNTSSSVFNLSAQPKAAPAVTPTAALNPVTSTASFGGSNFSGSDVWGDAWAAPEAPKPQPAAAPPKPVAAAPVNDFGWGSSTGSFASQPIVPGASGGFSSGGFSLSPPAPKVAADEEFGGWSSAPSATTNTTTSGGSAKPAAGFGGSEDLFSNVWE